jgi:hypothetical protein
MKPVVQLERTGCGLASVAAIAVLSYPKVKMITNALGIIDAQPRVQPGRARSVHR